MPRERRGSLMFSQRNILIVKDISQMITSSLYTINNITFKRPTRFRKPSRSGQLITQ